MAKAKRFLLTGVPGGGSALAKIDARLSSGAYFWVADDALPLSGTGTITAWDDRIQTEDAAATVTVTPTVQDQSSLSSKRTVAFIRASSEKLTSGSNITISQPFFWMIVVKSDLDGLQFLLESSDTNPTLMIRDEDILRLKCATNLDTVATLNTQFRVISALANGASSKIWTEDTEVASGDSGALGFSSAGLIMGSTVAGANFFGGEIAAVIMEPSDFTSSRAATIVDLESYYGVTFPVT